MRGIVCRGLRLKFVAALGIALAIPALSVVAETAPAQGTQTTLYVETHDQGNRTRATVEVTVTGEDGLPASGVVAIKDQGRPLAGAALNAQGQATLVLTLPGGDHSLRAAYSGDATHNGSSSEPAEVTALDSSVPSFGISISQSTLTLTPGQTGTITAYVTPVNAAGLTAPMFVTLSCSGLPDESACTFTPENIEILPNATDAIPSTMVIVTQLGTGYAPIPSIGPRSSYVAWAILLPGAFCFGGLAWGARRRPWLSRLSLLALLALVTTLGTTACAPRYNYFNHGPPPNPATPAGNYTVLVTAQSSNGITAITQTTDLALTVK